MFKRAVPVQQEEKPAPLMSAYEDAAQWSTQWWTDEGVYMGQEIAPPSDDAHPLRGDWACTGDACHYRGDRHIVTVGPNGSGKSRRLLLPNLFYLKDWSIVAIDPKGELFAQTAIHRAKRPGHTIALIDPFAVVKKNYPRLAARVSIATHGFDCESQGFNPLAALDPASPRFVDDAKALAVALIKTEGDKDKYWSQAAQALLKGILMAQRIDGGKEASLVSMRLLLGFTPAEMAKELALLVDVCRDRCPEVGASLSEFTEFNAQDRELGGIRRQAKVQTDWLGSAEIGADLKKGAGEVANLKANPTTIYLVLPPEYLATHGTWLRLMVTCLLRPLLREVADKGGGKPPVPVLFMLDEFAQLGHMEIIKDNYALMRGYGVKLWTVWQDLNQAKILYGDWWESFIGNAGMVQSFAPQDLTTRKYLSDLGGERMTWHDVESVTGSGGMSLKSMSSSSSMSKTSIKEPLLYPHELGQMRQGWGVVFTQRGDVHRRYFPDATHPLFAGVNAMMAEAAEAVTP